MTVKTPGGHLWQLYAEARAAPHLLIAGSTGAGKSTAVNGLISSVLMDSPPADQPGGASLILLDPKRVELAEYARLPHTLKHVAGYDPPGWARALGLAVAIMNSRYNQMERHRLKQYNGGEVFVIIDEWATVYRQGGRAVYQSALRLACEGRAARVHLVIAVQDAKAAILPTEIRDNIQHRIVLHCADAVQSRVIMGTAGAERLPLYGSCYWLQPGRPPTRWAVPMIDDAERARIVTAWEKQFRPRWRILKRRLF